MLHALTRCTTRWPICWRWQGGTSISLDLQNPPRRLSWDADKGAVYRPAEGAWASASSLARYLKRYELDVRTQPLDGYLELRQGAQRFRIVGWRSGAATRRVRATEAIVEGFVWPATPVVKSSPQAQLQALVDGIESLPEAFVLYDAEDRLMISNSAYAELYETIADILRPGVSYEEILVTSVARGQFQTGDDPAGWTQRRMEFHRRREGLFEQHLADGRWIQVSERATPSQGTTSIRADITLLKKREEELNELNRQLEASTAAKSRFLSVVSHELRTPINGILGIVQSLLLDATAPDQRTRLEIVLGSARMLTALLDDMLDISRIEAGRLELKPRPVMLSRFVDEIVSVVRPQAEISGIAIRSQIALGFPECVVVDVLRLRQIVLNFVSNAIRYSPPGEVGLDVRMLSNPANGSDLLRIEICDNGPGIRPEDEERLFRPFERAETSWSEVPEGIGLGLSICRDLAEAMGGKVGVDSVPGRGCRFWVELPLVIGDPIAAFSDTDVTVPVNANSNDRMHVLVIDDDGINRLVARLLLEKLGHRVTTCSHGSEGIRKLEEGGIGLVLLDIAMPRISGIDILRQIRAKFHNDLAVVAMTANLMADQTAQYLANGFQDVLPKPLSLEALSTLLSQQQLKRVPFGGIKRLIEDIGAAHTKLVLSEATGAITSLRDYFAGSVHDPADDRRIALSVHSMTSTAELLGLASLAAELRRAEADASVTVPDDRVGLIAALNEALATLERHCTSLS